MLWLASDWRTQRSGILLTATPHRRIFPTAGSSLPRTGMAVRAVVVWNGSRSSSLRSMKQGRSSATQSPTRLEIERSGGFWRRRRVSVAALPSAYASLNVSGGVLPQPVRRGWPDSCCPWSGEPFHAISRVGHWLPGSVTVPEGGVKKYTAAGRAHLLAQRPERLPSPCWRPVVQE